MSESPTRVRRSTYPIVGPLPFTMGVHRISLFGAVVLIVIALVLLFIVGPFGLILLVLAAILLYWAFGPGGRGVIESH